METATIENLPNNKCAIFFHLYSSPLSHYSNIRLLKCQTTRLFTCSIPQHFLPICSPPDIHSHRVLISSLPAYNPGVSDMQAQPHRKLQVLPSRFRFSQYIPLHLYCSFSHLFQVQGLPVSRYSIPSARIRCNFCQSPTVSCFCHIIIPASDRQHFSGNSRNCDRVFLWSLFPAAVTTMIP